MSRFKSDLLNVLQERRFIHQITDAEALDAKAAEGAITGYIGFDATADSLHVGNLVGIMMLHWMQRVGHRPIALMGGGTTKVGDPSFRADERPLLTPAQIDANIDGIKQVFAKYISYDGADGALMLNNAEWLNDLMQARRGQSHDAGGALAASGTPDDAVLAAFLRHAYFHRMPPKSLDRNDFPDLAGAVAHLSDGDAAATLIACAVAAVARGLEHCPTPPARAPRRPRDPSLALDGVGEAVGLLGARGRPLPRGAAQRALTQREASPGSAAARRARQAG